MSKNLTHTFTSPFITERSDSIPSPTIAYQTWGTLNEAGDNVVLVCHALTGDTSADRWFGKLFGPGNILDPTKYFIICPNTLGSCYGTTGPTSINPETERKYQADFPKITIRDIVRQQQMLFDVLEITGIAFIIGGSMGGMQALEWCLMDDRPKAAVLMGMGKTHRPWAIGISHTQRKAIYNDPNWNNGFYSADETPDNGLALARMIAMNSYRYPLDYDQKFSRRLQDNDSYFEIESYLDYQGRKLLSRFDAVSYIRLTQAMDTHDIGRDRADYHQTLGNLQIPINVIGIDSDILYPPEECRELAHLLPQGHYNQINSPHGHDAFLIEFDQISGIIESFLVTMKNKASI